MCACLSRVMPLFAVMPSSAKGCRVGWQLGGGSGLERQLAKQHGHTLQRLGSWEGGEDWRQLEGLEHE